MIPGMVDVLKHIDALPLAEKVDALNEMRTALHEISPFKNEPVDLVVWVQASTVVRNDYNPNKVAKPEMKLLAISIREDGITQPIVSCRDGDKNTVVDGFHRSQIPEQNPDIKARIYGYLPITKINKTVEERYASTVRHNRARGRHQVDLMGELVKRMSSGESDEQIAAHLGMTTEELLRLKQTAGAAKMLRANEYAEAWGVEE